MRDTFSVAWKEYKMLFRYKGGRMRFVLTLLSPVLLAFYTAWGSGVRWVELPIPVVPTLLVAVLAVIIVVPESFAGERERHTLETLLSTRLSDSSIVFGKMLIAMAFAMVLVAIVLVLGLLTVNFFHYDGQILLYTVSNLAFCVSVCMVVALNVTAIGVIISRRSETVQDATQTIAGAILVPPILLGMLMLAFQREIVRFLIRVDRPVSAGVITAVFLIVTLALVAIARIGFKRTSLLD